MNPRLFAEPGSAWEAFNNRWTQWVLNYSRAQQLDVLKQIGFATPTWEDLGVLLFGSLSGARARRRDLGAAAIVTASIRGCASSSG